MRPIVILDITAIPLNEGWMFEDWLKLFHQQGIVIWDSKTEGVEPKVIYVDNNEEIEIRDINQLEFDFTYDN
jgi:hypothetical protein